MFACLQHFNLLCIVKASWYETKQCGYYLYYMNREMNSMGLCNIDVIRNDPRVEQPLPTLLLHSLFIVLWKFQETKQSLYYVYYIYYTYREINIMGLCSNDNVLCYLDRWGAQRRGTPPCRAAWRGRWRGRCSPWPPAPCAAAPCSAAPRPRNRARYLHNNEISAV